MNIMIEIEEGRVVCVWSVRETKSRMCREFAAVLMAVDDGQSTCIYIYVCTKYTPPPTLASPPKFNWPVGDKNLSMPINRRGVTLEVTKYTLLYIYII